MSKLRSLAIALPAILAFLQTPTAATAENGSVEGFEARFVDVDGIRTRYYEVGQGEPMVLVHGSGFTGTASANTWTLNLGGLGEHFHVFAADKLASGMTDNPSSDDDLTIRAEVEHMFRFIQTMGLERVHLVGQSRGGGLAFLLAVNHPEIVETLVIVDSSTASPPAGDDRASRRTRIFRGCPQEENAAGDAFRCSQKALSYNTENVDNEYVAAAGYMWSQTKARDTARRMTTEVRAQNAIVGSEMNHDAYHRILTEGVLDMPVMLYWSQNDPSVLPMQAYSLYNIIAESNPRTWMLFTNDGGHFHYREHPEQFNRNVINFVTNWTAEDRPRRSSETQQFIE
ncbi:MAG: alpha/beta fold hydrolase [Gammaproteobacteria bacterium]